MGGLEIRVSKEVFEKIKKELEKIENKEKAVFDEKKN